MEIKTDNRLSLKIRSAKSVLSAIDGVLCQQM